MINTIFKTRLLKGAQGERGITGISDSIPVGGVVAYYGSGVPTGYVETVDPTGQVVSDDIIIGTVTYESIPSNFFDVLNIDENTTAQDVANFLNMSLRQGSRYPELYKDSSDYYTVYAIEGISSSGITMVLYNTTSSGTQIQASKLYAKRGSDYTLWGTDLENTYPRISYGWCEGEDQDGNTVYIFFNNGGSNVNLSQKGNDTSLGSSKVYMWNNNMCVLRKGYIIDTSNNRYVRTRNGYLTEVYKQNQTSGFILTINGDQYVTTNKNASYPAWALKI